MLRFGTNDRMKGRSGGFGEGGGKGLVKKKAKGSAYLLFALSLLTRGH
jgi:hypothetical protein